MLDRARHPSKNRDMLIYKVLRNDEFRAFESAGRSLGAPVDLADGYIHLSTAEQLPGTLAKHFANEDGLYLLALESQDLTELRWEPSRGGALFPHLYRALTDRDVLWSRPLPLTPEGHRIGDIS